MEFKKFLLVAAVAAFATVSCNKENGVNPSESVAGTYTGYSMAEFQYSPEPMVSENQTLTAQPDQIRHGRRDRVGKLQIRYVGDVYGNRGTGHREWRSILDFRRRGYADGHGSRL